MTSATARANLILRDSVVVEAAVPAHMLFLAVEKAMERGFTLRSDVMQHLNLAAVVPLTKLDELSVTRVAKRIEETATTLLREINPSDPIDALYVTAMFVLLLVDQKRFADVRNQAVLVSLLLIEDVKDRKTDAEGNKPVSGVYEEQWNTRAKKALRAAHLMGLYLRDDVEGTVQLSA